MYSVFRQLENGEVLHVASRDELELAIQLVRELKVFWPTEYVVRDSEGNDVDLIERPVNRPEGSVVSTKSREVLSH